MGTSPRPEQSGHQDSAPTAPGRHGTGPDQDHGTDQDHGAGRGEGTGGARQPAAGDPDGDLADRAERAGREAANSRTFGALVSAGLVGYGGVHIVIAWLFLQVAWSSPAGSGDRPITALSRTLLGQVLLWAAAAGMMALVAWRLAQAALRRTRDGTLRRVAAVATRLFEAVIYVLIAISAVQAALTRGRQGSVQGEGRSEQSLGAELLGRTWGRAVVMAAALAFLALGIQMFRSSVTRSFAEDLDRQAPRAVLWAGAAGTFVKGVALVIISALLAWAAVTYEPAKTGGLEAMIRTLRGQVFGSAVLTVLGVGLLLYGVYCLAWSAHARR